MVKRLFQAPCRVRVVAHLRQENAQVVKALGQMHVVGPEDGAADGDGLFEQRLGLVETPSRR